MRTRFWRRTFALAGLALLGCYAAAQATVVRTPIGGVIVENFDQEFMIGEGPIALGVISGDLGGGTFAVWPPPGEDGPAAGVITLLSGDTLRVQSQVTVSERVEGAFRHVTKQVTILSGTGSEVG
jgi:hypothetical protein